MKRDWSWVVPQVVVRGEETENKVPASLPMMLFIAGEGEWLGGATVRA